MKAIIGLLGAALFSMSGAATAATYEYSYTLDLGTTISGSFSGIAIGDLIVDLTNVTAEVDGYAFKGSGNLATYSFAGTWIVGGAYASFDGLQNNFMFSDAPPPSVLDWTNQFFSLAGDATRLPDAPPEIGYGDRNVSINGYEALGDFPPNSSWCVTAMPEPASVPEPAGVIPLLGGLAFLGFHLFVGAPNSTARKS